MEWGSPPNINFDNVIGFVTTCLAGPASQWVITPSVFRAAIVLDGGLGDYVEAEEYLDFFKFEVTADIKLIEKIATLLVRKYRQTIVIVGDALLKAGELTYEEVRDLCKGRLPAIGF